MKIEIEGEKMDFLSLGYHPRRFTSVEVNRNTSSRLPFTYSPTMDQRDRGQNINNNFLYSKSTILWKVKKGLLNSYFLVTQYIKFSYSCFKIKLDLREFGRNFMRHVLFQDIL